jgi:hypothetical protein
MLQNDEAALLQGEKEAEKMIVEAYSALLLAFLSTERLICHFKILFSINSFSSLLFSRRVLFAVCSKSVRDAIADCLPNHNLSSLVPVLERFVVCISFDL